MQLGVGLYQEEQFLVVLWEEMMDNSKIRTACNFIRRASSYAEMSIDSKRNRIHQVEAAKEAAEKSVAILTEHLNDLKEISDGSEIQ